ncbi:MAG: LamG domain-containing protein, partial [Hyphomicrobiales bacterium]
MPEYSNLFFNHSVSVTGLWSYFTFNEEPGWRTNSLLGSSPAYASVIQEDFVATGAHGNALQFDGLSTIRHIRAENDATAEAPAAKSVSLRFMADDILQDRTQILLESGDGFNGLNIYLQGDQLVVGAWSRGVWSSFLTRQMPADGAWHNVAFSFESSEGHGQLRAYFDGELFGESDVGEFGSFAPYVTLGGTAGGTKIEGGKLPGSNRFAGQIDEVAIFDRAITGEEVAVMAAATPVSIIGTPDNDELQGT